MKAVFGFNIESVGSVPIEDGNCFLTKPFEEAKRRAFMEQAEAVRTIQEGASLPRYIQIFRIISGMIAFMLSISLIRAMSDGDIEVGVFLARLVHHPAGIAMLTILIISLLIWISLTIKGIKLEKTVAEDTNTLIQVNRMDSLVKDMWDSLEVPPDAPRVEVFQYAYKPDRNQTGMLGYKTNLPFRNITMRMYSDEDKVCFANTSGVFTLPLSKLVSLDGVAQPAVFTEWRKEERYDKEPYKQYRIKYNNGLFQVPAFLRMVFQMPDERYEILFPPYEEETIIDIIKQKPSLYTAMDAIRKSTGRKVAIVIITAILLLAALVALLSLTPLKYA